MKARLATGRIWGLAVRWDAYEPEPAPVEAEVVHVIHSLPDKPAGEVRQVGAGKER